MKIVVFGEILWDIFGDEKKIGGAPFNFAAHVAQLGGETELISAVGDDALGREALKAAQAKNLDVSAIAKLPLATGYCQVTLHDGVPSYELVKNVAYDAIPYPDFLPEEASFYFGTLAQRDARSAQTLQKLLKYPFKEVFFDINIRQKFYSDEMIDFSLKHTTIFKISREEIGVLGFTGSEEEICAQVAAKYGNLKLIIVTLDKDGSFAYDCKTGTVMYSPKPEAEVVSTVGAGDSFSACFMQNYLSGASIPVCLERATLLSSYVVTQLGAVPEYPGSLKEKIL